MLQLREDTGEKLSRGTRITLHLKEDAHDLADDKKLASLVKQYSEFISFPIKLWSSSQDFKQVPSLITNLNVGETGSMASPRPFKESQST